MRQQLVCGQFARLTAVEDGFGDARPGSATIIVQALVNPAWLIEIEAVAAGAARAR